MLKHLPLKRPQPNAAEFIDTVMGRRNDRVPLVEYIVDEVVMRPILTDLIGRPWIPFQPDHDAQAAYWDNLIAFWHRLGYDCVRFEMGLPFHEGSITIADAAPGSDKQRGWADEHHGAITDWDEFERYPWPDAARMDLFPLEYIATHLPEGMGFITCHGGGVFEHLAAIMSIEGLCLAVYENPELVQAVADKVGSLLADYHRRLVDLDNLAAVFQGDDMGFRTSTLITPGQLRRYCLPWHKRFAAIAHDAGLPYFLHSCGNILDIMDDLIDDVGIDAKHSYEDAIIPVQDFHARYGVRIGVLGGVDVNILTQASPEHVRSHTRFLIETCGASGRYAVGSGNSIPSYIPPGNYLAMVDEALDLM